MKKTVFVSSTYLDLKKHRDAVRQVLRDFDVRINGMEDFGTRRNPPLHTCLEEIDQSQIYIGIISMVYGTVDKVSGKSFTQLEYERAVEKDLDINIFLVDEKEGEIKTGDIEFGENHEKLIHFKGILRREHTIKYFVNEIDLAQNVFELLKRITKKESGNFKRPPILNAEVLSFKLEEKECNLFIGKYNGRPVEIYTVIPDDEYDYLNPSNAKDVKIIRSVYSEYVRYDLQYTSSHGYRTTHEGFGNTDDTFFSVFDKFLNAILQSTEDKKTIIEAIKKIDVQGKDLNDWKAKILSVL